jgi:hypothetical protein
MRMLARVEASSADRWLAHLLGVLVASAVCLPFLGRGYVLVYDMVFVPRPVASDHGLGLDGTVPKAVPADFLVGVFAHAIPSWVIQQICLVAIFWLAFVGAWRLSPARTIPGAAASASVFAWNAYLLERLGLGQWSLLIGYALLPGALRAGLALRRGATRRTWATLITLLGIAAAAAPSAGVLVTLTVLGPVAVPDRARPAAWLARLASVLSAALLMNITWWLPGLLLPAGVADDPAGVSAFAARADTPFGGILSLATFGGIWNQLVTGPSRDFWLSGATTLCLVGLAGAGVGRVNAAWGSRAFAGVAVVTALGFAIATASLFDPGQDLLRWAVTEIPGGGLLRDAQKWMAGWALLVSACLGPGLEWLTERLPDPSRPLVISMIALLPVAALPDLGWGLGGRLNGVWWPHDYTAAADRVDAAPAGDVLVLPWHQYRAWEWDDDRTVLQPWDRMIARETVARDDLELAGATVAGQDPRAAAVGRVIAGGGGELTGRLRALGIRYVLIDRTSAGAADAPVWALRGWPAIYSGPNVTVQDIGPAPDIDRPGPPRAPVLIADAVATLVWLLSLAWSTFARVRLVLRSR